MTDKETQHLPDLDDLNSCSTTDCTGLIPAALANEDEEENYQEIYNYMPQYVDPVEEE